MISRQSDGYVNVHGLQRCARVAVVRVHAGARTGQPPRSRLQRYSAALPAVQGPPRQLVTSIHAPPLGLTHRAAFYESRRVVRDRQRATGLRERPLASTMHRASYHPGKASMAARFPGLLGLKRSAVVRGLPRGLSCGRLDGVQLSHLLGLRGGGGEDVRLRRSLAMRVDTGPRT